MARAASRQTRRPRADALTATQSAWKVPAAGAVSWLLPGMGHLLFGDRSRGVILLVAITATFWGGIAIGGVVNTVDYKNHQLWFVAQLGSGGHTIAAVALRGAISPEPNEDGPAPVVGHWMPTDIGVHYTGVAGLLSLLIILDAVARADRHNNGKPPTHEYGTSSGEP